MTTVFEAFSETSIEGIGTPENSAGGRCGCVRDGLRHEKSFLFDVASKVYVATDSAPVDSPYELCADAIDVVLDVASIYAPDKTTPEPSEEDACLRGGAGKRSRTQAPIQLSNGMALVLDEVDRNLALVCCCGRRTPRSGT